jgi:hypothetical protein
LAEPTDIGDESLHWSLTYAGGVARLLLVVLCSLVVAGCGGSGRAASDPPKDHGGFSGPSAKAFDATYRRCYSKTAKAISKGKARDLEITLTSYVGQEKAVDEGCSAGMGAAEPSGSGMGNGGIGPLYSNSTRP